MKTAKLFKTGRSKAVRLPKPWIENVDEVEMEYRNGEILIRPKERNLWQVAEECNDEEGFSYRSSNTPSSGVRVQL